MDMLLWKTGSSSGARRSNSLTAVREENLSILIVQY